MSLIYFVAVVDIVVAVVVIVIADFSVEALVVVVAIAMVVVIVEDLKITVHNTEAVAFPVVTIKDDYILKLFIYLNIYYFISLYKQFSGQQLFRSLGQR